MNQPVSRMFSTFESRTPAQKRRAVWQGMFICYLMVGLLLFIFFADRFVFYFAASYTKIAMLLVLLCTPFVLYWMLRSRNMTTQFAKTYPTRWLRNWVMMPLMAASMTSAFVVAPLGWLFTGAAFYGGPVNQMSAIAIQIGTYSPGKGCDQTAILRFASVDKETCLDNLYPTSTVREGQLLVVSTTMFPFGFLISSIGDADPGSTAGNRTD